MDELDAQLMSQLRCDLSRCKALNDMKGLDAFRLIEQHLGLLPPLSSIFGVTIPEVCEHSVVRLIRVLNVADNTASAVLSGF